MKGLKLGEMESSENIHTEPIRNGKRINHGSEAFRILDAALLAAEVELEREKEWLEHDVDIQLTFPITEVTIEVKNIL